MKHILHPGTVTYVDGSTRKVVRVVPVQEVPEHLRFAPTDDGPAPVVEVVAFTEGDTRTLREYGPDGQLLRTTLQRRGG